MVGRLGIALSAISLMIAGGIVAPAQGAPLWLGAAPVGAPSPARGHRPGTVAANEQQSQVRATGTCLLLVFGTGWAGPFQNGRESSQSSHRSKVIIDGAEQSATIIHMVKPVYPKEAKEKGIQGRVYFDAVIGKNGHVKKLRLISGHPILVKAAEPAVRQWIYKPTLLNGKPVEVETTIDIIFELPKHPKTKEKHR